MSFVINPYRFGGGVTPPVPDDAFAEYLFDSGTTTTPDTSGNGYTGTLINDASVADGILSLDGTGDRMNINDTDDFSFTDGAGNDTAASISAWIRPTQAIGAAEIIASKCSTSFEWELQTDVSGLIQLVLYTSTAAAYIFGRSGNTYVQNTWLHVVATYDGSEASSGIEIYLDGTNDTTTQDGVGSYTGMTNTTNDIGVGARTSNVNPFQGEMDNVRFFDRELSAAEVTQLFNEGHD